MSTFNKIRHYLGLDGHDPDHELDLPWEEDEEAPQKAEIPAPAPESLDMQRLVDALHHLYGALDADTRRRITGERDEQPTAKPASEDKDEEAPLATIADARRDEEYEKLKAEVEQLRKERDESGEIRAKYAEMQQRTETGKRAMLDRINDLQARLSEAEQRAEEMARSRRDPKSVETEKALAEALKEIEGLKVSQEQLETKSKLGDRMMSEMQAISAKAKQERDALQAQVEELTAELQEAARLREDVEKVGELLSRKDKRIEELSAANEKLKAERVSLKKTIESNLYNQAHTESQLRRRIKELEGNGGKRRQRKGEGEAETNSEEKTGSRKRTVLDKALESTDWLVNPEGESHADPDFGYHPPKRPEVPESEDQLSLF